MEVLFAVLSWIAGTIFCHLLLTGLFGQLPLADVSKQGQKVLIASSIPHFVLTWQSPEVFFTATGAPHLDQPPTTQWKVESHSFDQLTLHGDIQMPLDTSMGHLHFKFPRAFIATGVGHVPLIFWCLASASGAAAARQLHWKLALLVAGLSMCAGLLSFFLRCRRSQRTPLMKRRRQFLKEWPLALESCSRGPDRSMSAGQLQDFLQFFDTFIKERSMYYVCFNIVKPLTEAKQISFVELIGPRRMQWFISHYWGMPVRHFAEAVRKHAQSYQSDWRESAYWICTFSNSQWHVQAELGNGRWQDSSFYLALNSPECRGTAMIIDEQVLPLQRVWCLFEVYQTIHLSRIRRPDGVFQGLLLCTATGVLQEGRAGTDVAVAVAKQVKDLDTRSAEATSEDDRVMIHSLIEQMPGGFDRMNTFIRETIRLALENSHEHYEDAFTHLMHELSSIPTGSTWSPRLPTLLTDRCHETYEISRPVGPKP